MSDFISIVKARESCRDYDPSRRPARPELEALIEAARLAPSACNSQPWRFLVVNDPELSPRVAKCTQALGINKFTDSAPAFIVVCETEATLSAKLTGMIASQHFAPTDVGIAVAHIVCEAASRGLSTCILGWFSEEKLRELLPLDKKCKPRLVIAVGYAAKAGLRE